MNVKQYGVATATVEISRDELLLIKNVLYEAYVELGEWQFEKRIGVKPEQALNLLKSINSVIKQTI